MLELTYLVSVKQSDILALRNEPILSFYYESTTDNTCELQITVEPDTLDLLSAYLNKHDIALIQNNKVALIRFYT